MAQNVVNGCRILGLGTVYLGSILMILKEFAKFNLPELTFPVRSGDRYPNKTSA